MRSRFHFSIGLSLALLTLNGCAGISQFGPKYQRDQVDDFHYTALEIQKVLTDAQTDLFRIQGRLVAMMDEVEVGEARRAVRDARTALGRMKTLPSRAKKLLGIGQALLTKAPTLYMGPQVLHLPKKFMLLKEAVGILASLGREVTTVIEAGTAVVNCGSVLVTGGDRAPCHDDALASVGALRDEGRLTRNDGENGPGGAGRGRGRPTEPSDAKQGQVARRAVEPHALARVRAPQPDTVADRVEALAQEASELVRSGEFHGGIARYEEAYGIEPAAALLYNIAFVYDRKLDDPRSARVYYERYLLAPDAEPDGSARARDRLVDLKRVADRAPEPGTGSSVGSTASMREPETALRFAVVEPPRKNTWAWSLLGTGGVALGVGAAFQHMAGLSAVEANATQGTERPILAARVKDQELIGWSTMGLGVASAVTGGLLLLLDDEPDAQASLQVQPIVGPGLAGLSLGSRW